MRHLLFAEADSYGIALLIKSTSFNQHEIHNHYVRPLNERGIASDRVIAFTLDYNEAGKAPVGHIKGYLANLLPALQQLGVKYLYCCDSAYFKVLTKSGQAEPHYGYVLPCKIQGFEDMEVVLGLNYQALIYNPELQAKLTLSLKTLADANQGSYQALGQGIIHSADYPEEIDAIQAVLNRLHRYPELSADIEAFSLAFHEAGIATIGFAWDQHNGVAFACDYRPFLEPVDGVYGENVPNEPVRALLREFFETYQGTLRWHNASYDLRTQIYALWMKDPLDTQGLLKGLETMATVFHDTKIIAYLATNSTAGNVLGLKALAHEFAGNWAQDEINNVLRIPLDKLLQYNLVDCLCTNYVYDKYHPIMVRDRQEELYHQLMLPSLRVIIQMELTGMPMDQGRVQEAKAELERELQGHLDVLTDNPVIKMLNLVLQTNAMNAANAKLKTKQHPIEHFAGETFNPNSNNQLQILLYEQMGLPVIDTTATKQPATGGDTLEKLLNHTDVPEYRQIIEALIGHSKVAKILSAFIPSFEKALPKADGKTYLHGGFNLGGTVSGRLSSSKP